MVVALAFLVVGCSKAGKKPSARAIYDQAPIAEACLLAAGDAAAFETFKRDPYLNLLWENATEEEGRIAFERIQRQYPFLVEKFSRFQTSDGVGMPRVFSYGDGVAFSPYTLRLMSIAGDIQTRVGDLGGKKIVQIGAGYGGLCKVLHDLHEWDEYVIIDLPEQLALARKYLEALGVHNVEYVSVCDLGEFSKRGTCDFVISDHSFSEFDRPYQERLLSEVFPHTRGGYILGHVFPKHFGVSALDVETIEKKLKKNVVFDELNVKVPDNDRGEYSIFYRRIQKIT